MAYIIKHCPEDFIVKEKIDLRLDGGAFAYYHIRKTGLTTQEAVFRIAQAFHKRPKYINYAGTKDKEAVAEQYLSILHGPKRNAEQENLRVEFLGYAAKRLNLGDAEGNGFEIVVRNLDAGPAILPCIPNYFGEQRFGMQGNNHVAGKLLIQNRLKEAVELTGLPAQGSDYAGALRTLPRRILRLYPHAYQSYLWNAMASDYLSSFAHKTVDVNGQHLCLPLEKIENRPVPILGFEAEIPPELRERVENILKEERIALEDFRTPSLPELDLRGGQRDLLMRHQGLQTSPPEPDDCFPGRQKCTVTVFLPSGSYATVLIEALFGAVNKK